jgi:hypothetical protein
MKVVGRLGLNTVQLRFRKAQGFNTTVTLPTKSLGVDGRAVIADVASRLSDPKAVVVPGSLDKYDPKKLAASASAAPVEIEIVIQDDAYTEAEPTSAAQALPGAAPPGSTSTPVRRTFGKRSGTGR